MEDKETTTATDVNTNQDWLTIEVQENTGVIETPQETQKTETEDAPQENNEDDLLNWLLSLKSDDKWEEDKGDAEDADKENKDPFFNPNSEPEIFKKQIDAISTERDGYKTRLDEVTPIVKAIEENPALKSLVDLVQSGTPIAKIFAEWSASRIPPIPKTDTTSKAASPVEDNSPSALVARAKALRRARELNWRTA